MELLNNQSTKKLCPVCKVPMNIKTANKGQHQGKKFYVCPNYNQCKQVLPVQESIKPAHITKPQNSHHQIESKSITNPNPAKKASVSPWSIILGWVIGTIFALIIIGSFLG